MQELFAPPGEPWQPVSPQLRKLRRLVVAVVTGVVGVAVVIVFSFLFVNVWLLALTLVAVLAVAVSGWLAVDRNAISWGYSERDEDLYIKHGAMFRELIVVPYGRMQYVDVQAGPLEQAFGIASVHLHTASPGTSARIPGLPKDEAARLRDKLTALGETQAAGL